MTGLHQIGQHRFTPRVHELNFFIPNKVLDDIPDTNIGPSNESEETKKEEKCIFESSGPKNNMILFIEPFYL